MQYWRQLAAPEDCEDEAQSTRDRRFLYLSETFEGMWAGDLTADPVSGAIIAAELKGIYDEAVPARLGRGQGPPGPGPPCR